MKEVADSPLHAIKSPESELPSRRPRMLAITSHVPWPADRGGFIRSQSMLSAMSQHFDLHLLTAYAPEKGLPVDKGMLSNITCHFGTDRPRPAMTDVMRIVRARLCRMPYVMFQRHHRRLVQTRLNRLLVSEHYDAVYLDHLDAASYSLRAAHPKPLTIVDLHNVYSQLSQRVAEEERSRTMRWYLREESRLIARCEQRIARGSDLLFAVSEADRYQFEQWGARQACLVPNGIDSELYGSLPTGRLDAAPVILFVGALNWPPNCEAARFLATAVLPDVQRTIPGAQVRIVGRDPGPEIIGLRTLPGVEVHANVPDMLPYLSESAVLASPLDAGGGTRIKILEAFAAGLPVVSTAVGSEGLAVRDGVHLRIAERSDFSAVLTQILRNPAAAATMADAARVRAREAYSWTGIGANACRLILAAIDARRGER